MTGVRILVVQPSEHAPIGRLGEWLSELGAELDVLDPWRHELPGTPEEHSGLVVLGGETNARADLEHAWLASARKLLSSATSTGMPVLAIGLGAQLLATATGGRTAPRRDGPEAGTLLVAKRDAAAEDVLVGPLPLTPDVFQFHRDEISTLPPTAQLLAASPMGENQAFRVGSRAYGFQFHIETTPEIVRGLAERDPELARSARAGQFDPEHLREFHDDLAETWQPVARRFFELAATPPQERTTTRSLPLA
ncbi:GMP synthase-Glutamine amidotransferase [Actinopolyspora xinjiangensis]|uniref:GMP synthase-Glutamine amidotransferase n=1 Tax=Actinopolyspora xinjiangensis TaxID=405564 RepID=A0A1H0TDU2_9ACTN|nr:type 1 glutamine amidotransferase [Actinopolyspora xinjiangensis]SDP52179.1 GMP synthase-Glutamine amidotransferase [Actinopolyspora xinjiangensis]